MIDLEEGALKADEGGSNGAVAVRAQARRRRKSVDARDGGGAAAEPEECLTDGDGVGTAPEVARVRRLREQGWTEKELMVELHLREGWPLVEVAEMLGMRLPEAGKLWREAEGELAAAAPRAEADFRVLRERLAAGLWRVVEQTHGRTSWLEGAGEPGALTGADGGKKKGAAKARGAQEKAGKLAPGTRGKKGAGLAGIQAGANEGPQEEAAEAAARGGEGTMRAVPERPLPPAAPPPCPRLLALRLRALDQIAKLYGVNLGREAGPEEAAPYAAPGEIADEVRRKVLALHGRGDDGLEGEFEE